MQKFLLSLIALLGLCVAGAYANYTATQGVGTNFSSFVNGGVHAAGVAIVNSLGTEIGSTILSSLQGATPAGSNDIGKVHITDGTNNALVDPCQSVAKTNVAISQTASSQVIAGTSNKKTYICSIFVLAADAENVSLVEGTGSVCATGIAAVIGGTTAANGPNLPAGGGFTLGNGWATVAIANNALADNLCWLQSGAGRYSGNMTYVQQ